MTSGKDLRGYMLFAGANYYPLGGFDDFEGFFDTIDEAKRHAEHLILNKNMGWAHIVDDGKKVLECVNCHDYFLKRITINWTTPYA